MPQFCFLLVYEGEQYEQYSLAEAVELPDPVAACAHARLAILKVFRTAQDAYDWSNWQLSVRDRQGTEFAKIPITNILTMLGRVSGTAGEPPAT
jgi:hypothetical protein